LNKREKGYFIKIIPEGASDVKNFYFSPLKIKILKFFGIFSLFLFLFFTGFSMWMTGNFVKMKILEKEANKVKVQENKIREFETKLEKFILFTKKIENILKPKEDEKVELAKIKDIFKDTFKLFENEETPIRRGFFELPVKGIISNFYSVLHPGIDIVASSGSPVKTPFDGIVKEKGIDEKFGLYLLIEHKGGIITFYGHLKEVLVRKGQWVKKGEIIGKVGSSGKSTGPHLHFEVWKEGFPVNPLDFTTYNVFTLK